MSDPRKVSDLVKRGIATLQAGDRATAHALLTEAASIEPNNQTVLLWLSDTLDIDDERRVLLNQVVALDPQSREGTIARKKLDRMAPPKPAPIQAAAPAQPPPETAPPTRWNDFDFPPLPSGEPLEDFGPPSRAPLDTEQPRQKIPPLWVGVVALAVLLLLAWSVNTILNDGATGGEAVVQPTETPLAALPPTAVPPTADPNIAAPPTAAPPTAVPPTAAPPTAAPTTAAPPTAQIPAYPEPTQPGISSPLPQPEQTTPETQEQAEQPGYPLPPGAPPPAQEIDATSNGLGISRADWEQIYGEPTGTTGELTEYADGTYRVMFTQGVLSYLEQQFGLDSPITLEEAQEISEDFLPTDSEPMGTQESPEDPPAVVMNIYESTWLSLRLPITAWGEAPTGTFTVRYELEEGNVVLYKIGLGYDP
jgi:hypothetical protein